MKTEQALTINQQEFTLLGDKAIYWPNHFTLLIADVHFGKAAAYRAMGQPVPQGTTSHNLQRIDALLQSYDIKQIIFLGDFLHAPKSHAPSTLAALRAWRNQHSNLNCILIRGNHDLRAGDPPPDLNITVVTEPYLLDGFALQHIPKPHATHHVFAGHFHPTYQLNGSGRQRLTLPCFYHEPSITILPSFGDFTGGFKLEKKLNAKIFVIDNSKIWPVA